MSISARRKRAKAHWSRAKQLREWQRRLNERLMEMASLYRIPIIVTHDEYPINRWQAIVVEFDE